MPVLAVSVLLVGLLMPMSVGAGPNPMLPVVHSLLLCAILASPILLGRRPVWGGGAVTGALVLVLLAAATLISPTRELALGAVVPYMALAAILATDYRTVTVGDTMRSALVAANVLVIVAAVGVVTANATVNDFIVRFASMAEPDLVPNMTEWRKPVFTFGSHSTAAFGYYLLFLMQFETWRSRGGRLHLLLAILNLAACIPLTSASAVAFLLLGSAQLALISRRTALLVAFTLVIAIGLAGVVLVAVAGNAWQEALRLAFGAEDGGFRARYAAGGSIRGNLEFILRHPFRPIGLGYDPVLFFGDSGPVELVLRGSVPLLLLVYSGLAAAVRRAIGSRQMVWTLLGAIALFELGFSSLTFSRLAYLLCFTILYLRWLSESSAPARS